jgi:type IV pilus biogenesis protein CpaD/CtpE
MNDTNRNPNRHGSFSISTAHYSTGSPKMLPGHDLPQHDVVNIRICDSESRLVVDGEVSSAMFMRALMGHGDLPMHLNLYATGERKSDQRPEERSASGLLRDMVAHNDQELASAVGEVDELIRSMQEGHVKTNKASLASLRLALDKVLRHSTSNRDYVVDSVHRAVEEKAAALAGGLANQAVALGLSRPNELLCVEMNPVSDESGSELGVGAITYMPMEDLGLEIPEVKIEDMTANDLAREISRRLKAAEADRKQNPVNEFGHAVLYLSGAHATSSKTVRVWYVSYQGGTRIDVEEARRYLQAMREGKALTHYDLAKK